MSAPSLSFAHTVETRLLPQRSQRHHHRSVCCARRQSIPQDTSERRTSRRCRLQERGRQPPPVYLSSPQCLQESAEPPVGQDAPALPTLSRVGNPGSDDDIRTPPIPHRHLPALDIVPGTNIKLCDLTAPQLWTLLYDTTLLGTGMSFLGRIAQYKITRNLEQLVTLDLGRGEFAVLYVSYPKLTHVHHLWRPRFPIGCIVHIVNVTRLDVGRRRYLDFGERSSITRLEDVGFEVVERVNSLLDRTRKRSYAEVVVEEVRSGSEFLEQRSRRVRERYAQD